MCAEQSSLGNAANGRDSATPGPASSSIERLLDWTYRRQLAHLAERTGDGRAHSWGPVRPSVFFEAMRLGYVIPSTGGALVADRIEYHPDAVTVHQAVMTLPDGIPELLIRFSVLGRSPVPDCPVWYPEDTTTGRDGVEQPKALYAARGRFKYKPWLIPVVCSHSWEEITAQRVRWELWRHGLAVLSGHFRSMPELLKSWRVTGSLPPVAPWRKNKSSCESQKA